VYMYVVYTIHSIKKLQDSSRQSYPRVASCIAPPSWSEKPCFANRLVEQATGPSSRHLLAQLKLNELRHSGQVLALLVLNHLTKQPEWNKCLHVGQRLVGSCLCASITE